MTTIQEKVRSLSKTMSELGQVEPDRHKQHCFSLLHDAVLFTEDRIDEMSNHSLLGYITIASSTVTTKTPDCRKLRENLQMLGFDVVPRDMLN